MDKESLEDEDRCERPTAATTVETLLMCTESWWMIDLSVNEIANTVAISRERVENILHNK